MKIGILFSGQGSQYPGMGSDLYLNFKAASKVFDQAGDDIKEWCFKGTKEMLRQTHITQPSVYTVTMAAYRTLIAELDKLAIDYEIVGLAGFSMGEYAALTAAETFQDFITGLETVKKRGEFMTQAGMDESGKPKGAMAAVFGKRDVILNCIEKFRGENILEGVNFNSPMQTVVAGDVEAIDKLAADAKKVCGLKVKKLSVSTAFHSQMMIPASDKLRNYLDNINIAEPNVKVYSNVTGKDLLEGYKGNSASEVGAWIKDRLAQQARSPVYWQETIENMCNDGVEVFVEVGPGSTLSGFVSKIKKGCLYTM